MVSQKVRPGRSIITGLYRFRPLASLPPQTHTYRNLTNWQHGFARGHSCTTQLVLSHHQWSKALDEGRQVDIIFLDFTKAFDRVAHHVLLQKLCNFGISGALLNWCQNYLTNREQRVVIDRVNSSWCSIPSGIPQGSILGPLFFVIFINDLPEVVTPGNTVSLYADDCKTSRVINCPVHHSLFQSDIDNIYRWSLQNRMEFYVKKCKLMRICKKRSPLLSDLHLNNSTLESTSDFCDPGLVTNCNLSWNNHIDDIPRPIGSWDLVRYQLEFCSVVWSPYQATNIMKLERIQQRAAKLILKTTDEYQQRREKLILLSLEQRRLLLDVLLLYKALNGHIDIDSSNYVQFFKESDRYMLRRKDDCTLKKNYARTNINRIVDMWNSLLTQFVGHILFKFLRRVSRIS